MGLKDRIFGKKTQDAELDPLADLVLEKLRVGYLVDYDLKTWLGEGDFGALFVYVASE